jgi:hypothetical protein
MVEALLLAAAAGLFSGPYDCTFERQAVVDEAGAQPGAVVSFEGEDQNNWRFSVQMQENRNRPPQFIVTWPANPIQIAGTHTGIDLAPGHVAFVAISPPPCLFTEINCMALIQLSARDDGSAAFTIMPTGLAGDEASGRTQFHVVFTGSCRRQNGS